jgi:hypothetical protein
MKPFFLSLITLLAVHQRESQVYLKSKILEQMKEHRKKEIIVERYEAKLKEEHEQLAYEMQRANETRQRNQGQRNRNSGAARAGGVRFCPNLFISFYFILFYLCICFVPT